MSDLRGGGTGWRSARHAAPRQGCPHWGPERPRWPGQQHHQAAITTTTIAAAASHHHHRQPPSSPPGRRAPALLALLLDDDVQVCQRAREAVQAGLDGALQLANLQRQPV
jgi:hypothetical protein